MTRHREAKVEELHLGAVLGREPVLARTADIEAKVRRRVMPGIIGMFFHLGVNHQS